ncbi:NDR1/HIN1-like protein [Drosera capensis]
MTEKDCGIHGDKERQQRSRCLVIILITLLILILLIVLITFLVLRPTKPRFILQDATLFAFNVSSPSVLTITFQVTLWSKNRNKRVGIYYEKLDVFATYKNQQITLPTTLPAAYQGHKETTIWSPYLYGVTVPVAPYLAASLCQDQNAGIVMVDFKVDGKVKWKVGSWVSGKYHIWVKCPAYITFGRRSTGYPVGPPGAIKYQLASSCEVDV